MLPSSPAWLSSDTVPIGKDGITYLVLSTCLPFCKVINWFPTSSKGTCSSPQFLYHYELTNISIYYGLQSIAIIILFGIKIVSFLERENLFIVASKSL